MLIHKKKMGLHRRFDFCSDCKQKQHTCRNLKTKQREPYQNWGLSKVLWNVKTSYSICGTHCVAHINTTQYSSCAHMGSLTRFTIFRVFFFVLWFKLLILNFFLLLYCDFLIQRVYQPKQYTILLQYICCKFLGFVFPYYHVFW